ncbi:mucin-2-like isoform X1 [Anopheles moucheti]|uniref:mucin-2-like isoform X1 n=1 Tax=Anopheles moucheti TaxID=186751 RepID=UPI0022F10A57|nr:mucin-2-like isoform X1 [Anopheles moucheti]
MRKVWLLASAVLAFLNFVKSQEVARTLYSTRYDNLDIDTILGSNRLVSNYVDCLLSRKPCPPEGKDLKRILPEALRTKCARCSPIQKENALKIITRLYYDYPDQYRALRERWDPSGEYHRRFEEYLRGLQFNQIGGNGGTVVGTGVGNTIESGGNDRPVRNDLDRQPATQSSNVQTIVVNPALAGLPNGNVNTLVPIPSSPTPLPPSAVAPATERPRPAAPVPQGFIPPRPTNTVSNVAQSLQPGATPTTPFGTVRLDEVSTVPLWLEAQLAQQILPERPQGSFVDFVPTVTVSPATFNARPVVDGVGYQNLATAGQLPFRDSVYDGPTTTGRVLAGPRPTMDNGFDELPTAPPPVVVNRFGDDDANGRPSIAPVPAVPVVTTTTTTTTQRPVTTTVRQTRPATRQTTTRNTQRTTTRFAANPPIQPIVGLWNQLGTKIADTADAIAGMLKKTVDVLVTSHIQSHQRALRRI